MKYANKIHAKYTVIIGENEIKEKSANIKEMETGEQTKVSFDEIASFIKGKEV